MAGSAIDDEFATTVEATKRRAFTERLPRVDGRLDSTMERGGVKEGESVLTGWSLREGCGELERRI